MDDEVVIANERHCSQLRVKQWLCSLCTNILAQSKMTSIFRICGTKFTSAEVSSLLCKVSKSQNATQVAFITSKALRLNRPYRPPPFPYKTKKYNFYQQLFDPMMDRFDDNSKLIIVDGPPAVGKSKFALQLAEELEMLHMPQPIFDEVYINEYGFDIRELDKLLPVDAQTCDIEKFLTNPHHRNVYPLQIQYYQMRFEQYLSALLHLLSTGQGIVLNRSIFSDFVFLDAMINAGYLRPEMNNIYNELYDKSKVVRHRPHLVIYLDVPVDAVKEKIRKRGIPYEVNSKVLTSDYLSSIENSYKQKYLKTISQHAHVLIYDWTNGGDVTAVVEDIEQLDFEYCKKKGDKMSDWVFPTVDDIRQLRVLCTEKVKLLTKCMLRSTDLPDELIMNSEAVAAQTALFKSVPGMKNIRGYNVELGDNVLWKIESSAPYIRRTPRDLMYAK
ncbi:hypothetical protein KM043_012803 [Ampulex compressa]|nr:hypothetical protein KM043_012803 [Ampulex compressa]